jgi:hypothetical protein
MPFISLLLFTMFPVLAVRRLSEGGVRSLGITLLLAGAVLTVTYLLEWELATGRSGLIEVLAYGVIWTLPLLVASATILAGARLKISSLAQMALAYVTQSLAIAPCLWLALAACVQIRGSACTAP